MTAALLHTTLQEQEMMLHQHLHNCWMSGLELVFHSTPAVIQKDVPCVSKLAISRQQKENEQNQFTCHSSKKCKISNKLENKNSQKKSRIEHNQVEKWETTKVERDSIISRYFFQFSKTPWREFCWRMCIWSKWCWVHDFMLLALGNDVCTGLIELQLYAKNWLNQMPTKKSKWRRTCFQSKWIILAYIIIAWSRNINLI